MAYFHAMEIVVRISDLHINALMKAMRHLTLKNSVFRYF